MVVKGLDEMYLEKTGMNIQQIADYIMDNYLDREIINTITILSAGWDAFFGNYAVVRTAKNRHWVISKGEVSRYDDFAKWRMLL